MPPPQKHEDREAARRGRPNSAPTWPGAAGTPKQKTSVYLLGSRGLRVRGRDQQEVGEAQHAVVARTHRALAAAADGGHGGSHGGTALHAVGAHEAAPAPALGSQDGLQQGVPPAQRLRLPGVAGLQFVQHGAPPGESAAGVFGGAAAQRLLQVLLQERGAAAQTAVFGDGLEVRVLASESRTHPEVGRLFLEGGVRALHAVVLAKQVQGRVVQLSREALHHAGLLVQAHVVRRLPEGVHAVAVAACSSCGGVDGALHHTGLYASRGPVAGRRVLGVTTSTHAHVVERAFATRHIRSRRGNRSHMAGSRPEGQRTALVPA